MIYNISNIENIWFMYRQHIVNKCSFLLGKSFLKWWKYRKVQGHMNNLLFFQWSIKTRWLMAFDTAPGMKKIDHL